LWIKNIDLGGDSWRERAEAVESHWLLSKSPSEQDADQSCTYWTMRGRRKKSIEQQLGRILGFMASISCPYRKFVLRPF